MNQKDWNRRLVAANSILMAQQRNSKGQFVSKKNPTSLGFTALTFGSTTGAATPSAGAWVEIVSTDTNPWPHHFQIGDVGQIKGVNVAAAGRTSYSVVVGDTEQSLGLNHFKVILPPKKIAKKHVFAIGDWVELVSQKNSNGDVPIGTVWQLEVTHPDSHHAGKYWGVPGFDKNTWVHISDFKLVKPPAKVSFETVVLPDSKREAIKAAISQLENDAVIFDEWGFGDVFEKGTAISLLFWGIPGTGKTLTAQAIADEIGAELKMYGTAEIESSEPGGAERQIQAIFAEAKRKNKGKEKSRVILFDECDSLLMDRNEVGPILGAQVNALLTELERYEGIIIFTTNRMGKLDPALERRITAKIEFEFPDKTARKAIWERMLPKKAPIDKDVSIEHLSEYPLAGGNIKNAVLNAARMAAYKKAPTITMAHFTEAIEKEAESLQAFIAEYEKQTHQKIVGYSRERGAIRMTKQMGQKTEVKANRRPADNLWQKNKH